MINLLALDGHIVHAVSDGDRPLGDDFERAGQAAEAFAGLEVLGGKPLVAGLAVELVVNVGVDVGRVHAATEVVVGGGNLASGVTDAVAIIVVLAPDG
jgi:hypothetical protein